jgi:Tol biopolymer transport system component
MATGTRFIWHIILCLAVSSCIWMEPISVTSSGLIAGAVEDDSAISADGRYVVFTSAAALVPSDTNSVTDIYRRDTLSDKTMLVSVTNEGNPGDGASTEPTISGDGSIVVFASEATNFDAGHNGYVHIYVRDITAGTTRAATISQGPPAISADADSSAPSISADGTKVVFSSEASNLVSGDTNGVNDIYVYDVISKVWSSPVLRMGGAVPDGPSTEPSINRDGSMIAFTSQASNLVSGDGNGVADVFTVTTENSIERISERISEGVLVEGDGASGQPSIASLTNVVSFSSDAQNLVEVDTNGVSDIFVRAPDSNIQRISKSSGAQYSGASTAPSISADGNRIAFLTDGVNKGSAYAEQAVVADLNASSIRSLTTKGATHVSISADGGYASYNTMSPYNANDTNNISDVAARFAYTIQLEPWSLTPGKVEPGTETMITISGKDFRVDGEAPTISAKGESAITFSDVVVSDSRTITATMAVPRSVAKKNYKIQMVTPNGGPGGDGSTDTCVCLTVADPDPVADLVDIALSIGIPGFEGFTAGLLVDDLNDDSFDDIIIIRHSPTGELLLLGDGLSVSLTEVMEPADRHECDSADVNNDGLTDLYCSVGSGQGSEMGENNLWLQQTDGTYIDEAESWGVTDPYGRGRDVVFLDANNDGLPDLFVSNSGPRTDGEVSANRLFINSGGTTFAPAPEFGVDGELPSDCAHRADFNGDGYDDLLVCGLDRVRMYANQAGAGFVDVSAVNGFTRRFMDAEFADIDDDGDLDIAFTTRSSFEIHRLDQGVDDGVAFSQAVEYGKSVAFGDINGDSKPDAFFVQRGCRDEFEGNLPDMVAVNNGEAFTVLNPPDISRGCGDDVTVFDHNGDGFDGFLVGNGRGRTGPVQYLVLP